MIAHLATVTPLEVRVLTGPQLRVLIEALVAAYPTRDLLAKMLYLALDRNIDWGAYFLWKHAYGNATIYRTDELKNAGEYADG